jgi:hypothetical protein
VAAPTLSRELQDYFSEAAGRPVPQEGRDGLSWLARRRRVFFGDAQGQGLEEGREWLRKGCWEVVERDTAQLVRLQRRFPPFLEVVDLSSHVQMR